jgi:1,4-dihydroxy-6-naphthoate synthase
MQVMDHYQLLDSGAALGENCGPLLVARKNHATKMKDATIGVPGCYTTANLLFSLYAENEGQKVFMPFSRIMPALKDGLLDFGVIIHEGRFTYKHHGLVEVADLGKWWKDVSRMPIPLGGIISKKELPAGLVKEFTEALRDSISKALSEKGDPSAPIHSYVREHAQEMEMNVISKHIDLYVNDYSLSLGENGRKAVDKLFHMARENGL